MSTWEFPAPGPVSLRLRVTDGTIIVAARQTELVTVALDGAGVAGARVEFDQGTLAVLAPDHASLDAVIELPEGSSCAVNTASADIRCSGEIGALDVHTASGDVRAERVTGEADIVTSSGDVHVSEAAEIRAKTASGNITLGHTSGPVTARTASGNVRIAEASGRRTEATAASGNVTVAVPPGAGVYLDLWTLSGNLSSDLDPAHETAAAADITVHCRSISGNVRVGRAAETAAR
jgi:DUF4097 and DUF4098 domain-containing protein YvlB